MRKIKIRKPSGEIIEIEGELCSNLIDKTGKEIIENDEVKLFHYGKPHICKIIFEHGMFCLKWPDGYINKHPLSPERLEVIDN